MKSDNISLIASEPFVNAFTVSIFNVIQNKKFSYKEKHVVHSDLIPKFSERIVRASLGEKTLRSSGKIKSRLGADEKSYSGLNRGYGKIALLLDDPSISTIECKGMGKLVTIVRAGRIETSKIVLDKKDIREILENVSEMAHIPLVDGVFRATADNFSISAIISEVISSRFLIKKDIPYSTL